MDSCYMYVSFLVVCLTLLLTFANSQDNGLKWPPEYVHHTDKDVKEIARFAVGELNRVRNDTNPSKLVEVRQAQLQPQIVASYLYLLNVTIRRTSCKTGGKKNLDRCQFDPTAKKERCQFNVLVVDAQMSLLKPVVCQQESSKIDGSFPFFTEFELFREKYQRSYQNDELVKRYYQFADNMERITGYNKMEQGSATYGTTQFADLHPAEFKQKYTGLNTSLPKPKLSKAALKPESPTPDSFDWRTKGAVTPVKNQGQCGSCWAFSTTGNIEGQWKIKKGSLVSVSEQQLVDCDKVDHGCEGGLPSNAYQAILRMGGLETEKEYPYKAEDEKCAMVKPDIRVYINSSVQISSDEQIMATWLASNGPISIGINAAMMQFYMGGVAHPWKIFCNPAQLDHGVLIVGYGTRPGILWGENPYWVIKNSWGPSWGEEGYYLVYRGAGVCGLNKMCTSSVIDVK